MSEWIDVDVRVPEFDQEVLIATRGGQVFVAWLYDELDGPLWLFNDGRVTSWVTHWMPLPEPPK